MVDRGLAAFRGLATHYHVTRHRVILFVASAAATARRDRVQNEMYHAI